MVGLRKKELELKYPDFKYGSLWQLASEPECHRPETEHFTPSLRELYESAPVSHSNDNLNIVFFATAISQVIQIEYNIYYHQLLIVRMQNAFGTYLLSDK